jgi:hypothetical protein
MFMRTLMVGVIALGAIALVDSHGVAPAMANGPDTSFSVDLDAGAPGIQTTRTVPLNTPFSVSVWLDATNVTSFIEVDVKMHYDDVHLTAPASGLPSDWKNASVLDTTGGTSAPWPAAWNCAPDPGSVALTGEDNIGIATLYTGCAYELSSSTFFTGAVFEYVLRCDIDGPAALTIDNTDYTYVVDGSGGGNVHFGHKHNASVNCGSGSGDADNDGMPNTYENAHACLNPSVADASGDPDVDNFNSIGEFNLGSDPCDNDTDNDGCADGEEYINLNPASGGDRDPLVTWDFGDVPTPTGQTPGTDGKLYLIATSARNKAVTLTDVGVVLAYVGRTSANTYYTADGNNDGLADGVQLDRTPSTTPGKPWRSAAPNNAISLQDVGVVLAQVGHNCNPPP